jgi:hypothetical protein
MEKNKFTLVIPEGWTKEEYIRIKDGKMPGEEPTSFWDRPFTGNIFEIAIELFFVFLKCVLFFLEEYPKALDKVREEERTKQKSNLSSTAGEP